MGIRPFTIAEEKTENNGIALPDFTKSIVVTPSEETSDTKKRRSRSKKANQDPLFTYPPHMGEPVRDGIEEDNKSRELSFLENNEPYEKKYQETNNILRSAISQLDMSMIELQQDIENIRQSKTMRGKYNYLSLLQGSMSSMIGNKIAAARELNNTISKCNDFEMKRFKEIKASNSNKDDDQTVMEMYKAFVNTPVSASPLPNINQLSVAASAGDINAITPVNDNNFNTFMNNLSPSQNMMFLKENPNIQQVVVYNQETGARYFDVIDMTTGQSVPNSEKHDPMFLEDVDIDIKNKVARNINIGESYPLVIVGQPILNEY